MLKRGFTLIELLIVIVIITILAGGVIPYVQNYLEDARFSRAKSDLNEIRNSIMRYETDQSEYFNPGFGKTGDDYKEALKAFQQKLVGPYLIQAMSDPWGRPYYFSNAASIVFSGADDGSLDTSIISADVRPLMAPTRAWWSDYNNNGRIDANDVINIKFSRPIGGFDGEPNNIFMVTPPASTTIKAAPFGTGAVIETFSSETVGNRKHPRGNNWIKIIVRDNAEIKPGDSIIASSSFFDSSEASIIGRGNIGIYADDKVLGENWFADNGTIIPNRSSDTKIQLKAAQ